MSKLTDAIKASTKGIKVDTEALVIEQRLNKLFFEKPNLKEELRFLEMKRGSDSKDRYGLHASAIIVSDNEFCLREQALSLFYKQLQNENISVGLKRIFMEGDYIHEKWQRLFIRGNLGAPEAMDNSRFNTDYDLSFTPDIAPARFGKIDYVVEIKSMNTFLFKKAKTHQSGVKQLKFYMWLTGIHNGFVLVEDKNTQEFKVFMVNYNESDVEKYIERLELIQKAKRRFIERKKPPGRDCESASCKRALKCNMRDACFNVGMGRVKLKSKCDPDKDYDPDICPDKCPDKYEQCLKIWIVS